MNQIGGADKVRLLNILMQLRKVVNPPLFRSRTQCSLARHPPTIRRWHPLFCTRCATIRTCLTVPSLVRRTPTARTCGTRRAR